ncbi:MAG: 4-(cytidine 5'-diphospho)-2-C-methyl-D-erythritol kinase [Methylobacter tundripaludum]|jgi:4-diphosphocytidyl-2-C-methyl-D-erythritol kinase|uniref:4-diphosphocytidyl-2-C-methyl-D-erythritol kinase n=1 Tax=Methylobacter tundripaludum TaxID=173365 RepID=A0A2S6HIA4_9GAMM|nr:4-(cytidine 5'-diphospho)-2-C-methyl-D-erythritol kinase [Methylobacter tundripaludum]MDD4904526.1 4-(cytidine 5'-diphospho)-2-C-methyl-D-erythritol kinase [Methylobacter tundripaludum]PPK77204.1 4-diphosphocytidyl-2-C-methyl-D-erythritol kinase [Methylobacter tundripaludum]
MTQNQINQSAWAEKWPAPAKLNLMLRITGQRSDGYHLLQTVFQFIELCDWITFHPVDDGRVSLQKPIPGVPEADDLIIRAAKLLKAETGCEQGVRIEVEKNLPMGGGLGGGSSDAATTLVVLNALWGLQLSMEKLMELGLTLGADVPVFVYGYSSWAEGVGEKLERIDIPEQWFVVIKPNCHVDTKEVFLSKDLTRNSKSIRIADFIAGQHQNDCLGVVRERYQSVKDALVDLSEFSEARLTGTGACVFAQFDSEEAAVSAYRSLQKRWQVYLVRGVNESPLFSKLKSGNIS